MPTIEVFLMFPPSDRNSTTIDKRKTFHDPGWNWIKRDLAKKGYTLVIHGPSVKPSVQDIRNAMNNAEVTLLVGHGASINAVPGKFVSSAIHLSDGMIKSPDGVLVGTWANGNLTVASQDGKLTVNKVTGVFTCNSTDRMPDAFNLPPGSHLITNDGGSDGLTRVGTLEQGAATFVTWYAATKGDVRKSMTAAQGEFAKAGTKWASDQGDRLSDRVGAAPPAVITPPPPPRCEVKDW